MAISRCRQHPTWVRPSRLLIVLARDLRACISLSSRSSDEALILDQMPFSLRDCVGPTSRSCRSCAGIASATSEHLLSTSVCGSTLAVAFHAEDTVFCRRCATMRSRHRKQQEARRAERASPARSERLRAHAWCRARAQTSPRARRQERDWRLPGWKGVAAPETLTDKSKGRSILPSPRRIAALLWVRNRSDGQVDQALSELGLSGEWRRKTCASGRRGSQKALHPNSERPDVRSRTTPCRSAPAIRSRASRVAQNEREQ